MKLEKIKTNKGTEYKIFVEKRDVEKNKTDFDFLIETFEKLKKDLENKDKE